VNGLANKVVLSEKGHPFLADWIAHYKSSLTIAPHLVADLDTHGLMSNSLWGLFAAVVNAISPTAVPTQFDSSRFRRFDSLDWDFHATKLPLQLANERPDELLTVEGSSWYSPNWASMAAFYSLEIDNPTSSGSEGGVDLRHSWLVHTWRHAAQKIYLDRITGLEQLLQAKTTFARVARIALGRETAP
jgi:hypothetical protein